MLKKEVCVLVLVSAVSFNCLFKLLVSTACLSCLFQLLVSAACFSCLFVPHLLVLLFHNSESIADYIINFFVNYDSLVKCKLQYFLKITKNLTNNEVQIDIFFFMREWLC